MLCLGAYNHIGVKDGKAGNFDIQKRASTPFGELLKVAYSTISVRNRVLILQMFPNNLNYVSLLRTCTSVKWPDMIAIFKKKVMATVYQVVWISVLYL